MIEHRRSAALVVLLTILLVSVDLLLMDQRAWTVLAAAVATAFLCLLARAAGLDSDDLGLRRDRLGRGLRLGAGLSGLAVLGYAVAVWVPSLASAFNDDRTPDDLASLLVKIFVVIPLRTVLLEELAFRGVLWGWLAKSRGERIAAWGSSLAFGLWHVPPALVVLKTNDALASSSPGGTWLVIGGILVGTTAVGLLLAELRRRTQSLAAPALLHWTVNAAGSLGSYVVRGRVSSDSAGAFL